MVDIYKGVYFVNGFWGDFDPKKVTIAYIVNGTCLHCKLASEAWRKSPKQYSEHTPHHTPGETRVYIIHLMRRSDSLQDVDNKQVTRINDMAGYYSEYIAEIAPFRAVIRSVCVFMRKIQGGFSLFIPLLGAA